MEPLIGPNTINTLPLETIEAYRDHGEPAQRLEADLDAARMILDHLAELGININAVTEQLEGEGVEKFIKPYEKLIQVLESKRLALIAIRAKSA